MKNKLIIGVLSLTIIWTATGKSAVTNSNELLIDNFDQGLTYGVYSGRKTSIGAYQGTWAKRPSYSLLRKSEVHRHGHSGKGAILEWKKEGGWCGWYSLLEDAQGNPANATPYNALCFWIKGNKGGEKFDIGMTDHKMQAFEVDAFYAGSVNTFLPGGVTTNWQEVKVPLSRWESAIDLSRLGSLVFWFSEGGEGKLYFDDIVLRNDPDVAKIEAYNAPRAERDAEHPRALWVWKIDPINNKRAGEDLYKLCENCAIERIFLFFGDFNQDEDSTYTAELEQFIEGCHKRGIHVEALTGNPVWALKENHPLCIKWLESFLEYNKSRPAEKRFDGASLDVEPYLTGEWVQNKSMIKEQYLELLSSCRELVDSYDEPFQIGAAIPMAYEQEEKVDGFESRVLGYLDYIALMDYYDTPKKIIDNGIFHIELAGKLGKKVWLGAEIQDLVMMKQGNRSNTFWEEGWVEMENVLGSVQNRFLDEPGYGGLAMHCYYAYKILQRERNVPHKERPLPDQSDAFVLKAGQTDVPLEIDGKLDDWKLGDPIILDAKDDVAVGRGSWVDANDLSVKTYAMWDIENIYLAFVVTDDTVVQEKTGADMWEGDHIECWLDVDLLGDYTEAANSSDDFQFGFSPGNFDDITPEVFIWTPYIDGNYQDQLEIASTRTKTGYIMEIRLPQEFLLEPLKKRIGVDPTPQDEDGSQLLLPNSETARILDFNAGLRLGICIDPSDCDNSEIPQKLLMSTSGEGRTWGDPTTFGFLELKGNP